MGEGGGTRVTLQFPEVSHLSRKVLVKEAALSVSIRGQKDATLVQLVRGEEGISLATSSLEEEVDVADVLQGWLERPNSNLGFLLLLPPGSELQGLPNFGAAKDLGLLAAGSEEQNQEEFFSIK